MRFLTLLKTAEDVVGPPPAELVIAMDEFQAELAATGVLVSGAGLAPSTLGARVRLSDGELRVTDGPFAEAKELIVSYALLELPSRADAVDLAARFLGLHRKYWDGWEGEAEIRPVVDRDDLEPEAWERKFGSDPTP